MTELAPAVRPEALQFAGPGAATLEARLSDVLVALVTFAASLAVLVYGMSADANFPIFIALHLAVLTIPAALLIWRSRQGADLTIPLLLLTTTAATGPIGALGCAGMTLPLWFRRPTPWRLQYWYDYISGVVARRRVARIYDELISDRLPTNPDAKVPRFNPILQGTSLEEQQQVLGVIGRRYHPDFRLTLRKALRNKNGFIRAQAAAIASHLSAEEKARLWSSEPLEQAPPGSDIATLDVEPRRP